MEVNNSSAGNPDQFIGWTLDEDLQGRQRPRSYTCAFCKRGFSNAQALGGHMNIHRRDRAKLKQASEELSLDSGGHHPADNASEDSSSKTMSEDEGNSTPKRATHSLSSINDGDGTADDTQMMIGEDFGQEGISGIHLSLGVKVGDASSTSGIEKKNMQLSKHFAQSQMVDLELRLGPETHETSRKST